MADSSPEAVLAREEEGRNRAAAGSIGAGVAALLAVVAAALTSTRRPDDVSLLETLPAALQGRSYPEGPVRQVTWIGENVVLWGTSGVLGAVAALLALLPLRYLFRATAARNPQLGRAGIIATAVGCILSGVGLLVYIASYGASAVDFANDAERTLEAARDIPESSVLVVGAYLNFIGQFGFGLALVLVSMNAMRVGLLTRFFGVLGILAGVLLVLPIDQPGIIRSFFFIALGLLFLGRWMGGRPPAWQSGEAQPWPSQQELRERREALRRGEDPDTVPAADPSDPRGADEPAAAPRSRKRRKRR